ncbi:DUF397 domain-containing protein [Embleya sp. NBC_00896]|uniref:DUF397 domain-containing protein n=1 Tax=Embleya sp. NBC_00896 TaxID=2975961 RepID=UPI003867BE43|nr:DUF397 domain-containing protein [Embleya sp. NBC_00896]
MSSVPAPAENGAWVKSSYSGGDNDCVETRLSKDSAPAVRDSKLSNSPVQSYESSTRQAFVDALISASRRALVRPTSGWPRPARA